MNIIAILIFIHFTSGLINNPKNKQMFVLQMKKTDNFDYYPRSLNQRKYVNALINNENKMVIGVGPAGCGKTVFACQSAIKELQIKKIDKIIITRPLKSVENEDIGYLPGTLNEKLDPWTRPIIDVLNEIASKETIDKMIRSNIIELCPLAYMRGRTFKDAFIIADEMQNSSPNQMRMLTTRLGERSKMVINGDLKQSDYNKENNGLKDLIEKIEIYNEGYLKKYIVKNDGLIKIIKMDSSDIQRSELVSRILQIYDYIPINYNNISYDFYQSYNVTNDDENPYYYELDG